MGEARPVSFIIQSELIFSFNHTPEFNRDVIMIENAPLSMLREAPQEFLLVPVGTIP